MRSRQSSAKTSISFDTPNCLRFRQGDIGDDGPVIGACAGSGHHGNWLKVLRRKNIVDRKKRHQPDTAGIDWPSRMTRVVANELGVAAKLLQVQRPRRLVEVAGDDNWRR